MNPEDIIGNKKDLEKILKEVEKNSPPNKESSSEETRQEKTPQRQVPPFMKPGRSQGVQNPFSNNSQQIDSEDEELQEEQEEFDTNYDGKNDFQSQYQEDDQNGFPSQTQSRLPFNPRGRSNFPYANQPSDELTSQELGKLLVENLWGFALGILMKTYKTAVERGLTDEVKFIRTDVQNFVGAKGRHRFRSIPHQSIQDFIDECVASNDSLDDEEYLLEKTMREQYGKSGTVEAIIQGANDYHKARENRDLFPYESSGNDHSDW